MDRPNRTLTSPKPSRPTAPNLNKPSDPSDKNVAGLPLPFVSVVIPVRNDPGNLVKCLRSLKATLYRHYEIIVVDDASTDDTRYVAEDFLVKVFRLETQSGPAVARNVGAEKSRGDYLFFLDADVCVKPETIGVVVDTFLSDSTIDALFGSYDNEPSEPNVVSRYRNLLHHSTHQLSNTDASTFWSGCGAIKRLVFFELGGLDPTYRRPSIEDIEFGVRLRKAGYRTVINKDIQVKHLKKWTFWSMIKTDVLQRAIPWTELILQEGEIPDDLNLRSSQRVATVLAYGLLVTAVVGAWHHAVLALVPVATLLGALSVDAWTTKRPVPLPARYAGVVATVVGAFALGVYFPLWSAIMLSFLFGIVLLNSRFLAVIVREINLLYTLLVLPLLVLYYIYSGFAFGIGICRHLWKETILLMRTVPKK